jgi:ATP-dependent exoDNAse (exonuclease V) alpha subunit
MGIGSGQPLERKNSTVAREFEVALPEELSADERKRLALNFAREVVARHGCIADVAIHAPGKSGDNRNHHAHILCSTRRLTSMGFGEKTRELDDQKSREIDRWRERFAELQNAHLLEAGFNCVVDHRSLFKLGIDRQPTMHNGPILTAILRRGGTSYIEQARAKSRLEEAAFSAKSEIHFHELSNQIILLSTDLRSAITERERIKAKALTDSIQSVSQLSKVDLVNSEDCNGVDDINDESEQVYRP